MQVLHIACVAPPQSGGIGKVADTEVRLLLEHGVQSWLACPKTKLTDTSEHTIRLPAYSLGNASYLRGLKQRVNEADIVHLHYPYYGTAKSISRYKERGIIKKLAITLHMDAVANGLRGCLFDAHREYIQPNILKTADKLFVSSMDYALHSSYKNVTTSNPGKVVELPFGIDAGYFSPGPANKTRFTLPDDAFVVGNVSVQDRAHKFKGIELLIKSLCQTEDRVHLLLVGEGEMQASYRALADNLNLTNRVHFTGKLSRTDLLHAYRTMDVFAFPSTNGAEAFGLAMLEAMSVARPVIASNLPGVRHVAQDGGILIEPDNITVLAEAINQFANNRELVRHFSESARAQALKFTWDNHARQLIRQYQQLCA